MPRFTVTVQAILDDNRSGPHFSLQLPATDYLDALRAAVEPLEKALNDSGLGILPVRDLTPVPVQGSAAQVA